MANFHDKIVLNKYLLSLFGIDALGTKILSKNGVEIFKELKLSTSEGYTDDGNTKFLEQLKSHLYLTEDITGTMLQEYDENIVRFTREISEQREHLIVWKYFQYLSLLFTEIYLDKFFADKDALLEDLNAFVHQFNEKQFAKNFGKPKKKGEQEFRVTPFKESDLNKLAFWNATGSGKTLLMHINIKQYLHYAKKHAKNHENKILLITPNEPLSRQHLQDFKLSGIPANIFSKSQTGMFSGKEVEILEISKLSEESKDKTVAVESFETENLVLVDEGHGGMKGDQWKKFRDSLSTSGFAFEYSATFGQAISSAGNKANDLTQEYSKSILFDYSYKYFYEDGYGKDYRILNLKEDKTDFTQKYLTANLLSFYQQLLIFKNRPDIVREFRLFKPLWVFVGGSVNAVRESTVNGKKIKTSDVLEILQFLSQFLKEREKFTEIIDLILKNKAGLSDAKGYSIFEGSFKYLEDSELSAEEIYKGINEEVFHNYTIGANLYLDNLKGAQGELGLRIGDTEKYFGVINVGDEDTLHKLAMEIGILGVSKDFSDSLFAQINLPEPKQEINLLIGSKKFSEGWSSWRVSSMGLMNIGKSEGSQIIQLFGRGVRLQGYGFSLKRSKGLDEFQKPDHLREVRKYLQPLETLQIFGVNANYMEQFKKLLEEEGLPPNTGDWLTIEVPTVNKIDISTSGLKLIQVKENVNFKKNVFPELKLDINLFHNRPIEIDWYPKIDMIGKAGGNVAIGKEKNNLTKENIAYIDWTQVFFEIQNFKADKGFSNIKINIDVLKEILADKSWYKILIPADQLEFSSFAKVKIWQELAIVLLKKYVEHFYVTHKNKFNAEHIETRDLLPTDENFIAHYDVRLNRNEEIEEYEANLKQLKEKLSEDTFSGLKIAEQVEAFDNLLHLYKPVFYVGKGYDNILTVFPVALNESEKDFMNDLEKEAENLKKKYKIETIFLLRNQSKKGIGFFADGNNFYPDFILWLKKGDKQYLTFIDPKGIRNSNGINDAKIQFYRYLQEKVQPQVSADQLILNSFIVSNSNLLSIHWRGDLSETDFNNQHVYFQLEQKDKYMEMIFEEILK